MTNVSLWRANLPERLRNPGWRSAIVALTVVAMVAAMSPLDAHANHGSWTHHEYHVGIPNVSQYDGYSDIDASDNYDYGHARFVAKDSSTGETLENEEVTCSTVGELCSYRKTTTVYWYAQPTDLEYYGCARDDDHELWGDTSSNYTPCRYEPLPTHIHTGSLG